MRYIIILLTILLLPHFVLAEEIGWTSQKIIDPMKQFLKGKNIKEESQELLNKAEKTIEQKQEEIVDKAQEKVKQEVKKSAKNWLQRKIESTKRVLAPLKNKIQQGRGLLREQVYRFKNYLKSWLR